MMHHLCPVYLSPVLAAAIFAAFVLQIKPWLLSTLQRFVMYMQVMQPCKPGT
jgi:hypothetical protein